MIQNLPIANQKEIKKHLILILIISIVYPFLSNEIKVITPWVINYFILLSFGEITFKERVINLPIDEIGFKEVSIILIACLVYATSSLLMSRYLINLLH